MTPEEAYRILDMELGDIKTYDKDCLINHYLDMTTPLGRDFAIWLASRIAVLRGSNCFETFKGKLKSKDNVKFNEALSILEIAYKFSSSSFSVSFIPESDTKTPDMQIHAGNTDINLEVTQMFNSEFEREIYKLREEIHNRIIKLGVCYAGVISIPSDKYNDIEFIESIKPLILEKLDNAIKSTTQNHQFHTFKIDSIMDFAVSPQISSTDFHCIDSELLTEWVKNKNEELKGEIKLSLGGIIYYYPKKDILQKVKDKLTDQKKEQLSVQSKAGIIVVVNKYNDIMGIFYSDENVRYFLETMENYVNNNPEVTAFIFYNQFGGVSKSRVIKNERTFFFCKSFNLAPTRMSMVEESIIIFNKNAMEKLPKEVISNIINTFEKY